MLPSTAWAAAVRAQLKLLLDYLARGWGRSCCADFGTAADSVARRLCFNARGAGTDLLAEGAGFSRRGGARGAAPTPDASSNYIRPRGPSSAVFVVERGPPLLFSLLGAAVDLAVIRGRDAGLGVTLSSRAPLRSHVERRARFR